MRWGRRRQCEGRERGAVAGADGTGCGRQREHAVEAGKEAVLAAVVLAVPRRFRPNTLNRERCHKRVFRFLLLLLLLPWLLLLLLVVSPVVMSSMMVVVVCCSRWHRLFSFFFILLLLLLLSSLLLLLLLLLLQRRRRILREVREDKEGDRCGEECDSSEGGESDGDKDERV